MSLPTLAQLEQLSERLGASIDAETLDGARAAAALEDASALVRSEAGKTWLDDHGDLDEVPSVIESITMAIAFRAYRNPDGATQKSLGDASISFGRTADAGASGVYITAAERRIIRREAGKAAYGAIDLEVGTLLPNNSSDMYVPVEGGGDSFPIGPAPWE